MPVLRYTQIPKSIMQSYEGCEILFLIDAFPTKEILFIQHHIQKLDILKSEVGSPFGLKNLSCLMNKAAWPLNIIINICIDMTYPFSCKHKGNRKHPIFNH